MQRGPDLVWEWSEAFLEVVERWIEKPPSAAAQRRDWTKHKLRLALWQREVEKARARYLVSAICAYPSVPGVCGGCTTAGEP